MAMAKMPMPEASGHGGRREGAGRRRVLTDNQMIELGALYDEQLRRIQRRAVRKAISEHALPRALKRKVQHMHRNHRKSLEKRTAAGNAVFGSRSRLYRIVPSRPYRCSAHVVRIMQRFARMKWRITLTRRRVREAVAEYRDLRKALG